MHEKSFRIRFNNSTPSIISQNKPSDAANFYFYLPIWQLRYPGSVYFEQSGRLATNYIRQRLNRRAGLYACARSCVATYVDFRRAFARERVRLGTILICGNTYRRTEYCNSYWLITDTINLRWCIQKVWQTFLSRDYIIFNQNFDLRQRWLVEFIDNDRLHRLLLVFKISDWIFTFWFLFNKIYIKIKQYST